LHTVITAMDLYRDRESFPDTSKVIQVFSDTNPNQNYIANTKTEPCLNPNSCHCN